MESVLNIVISALYQHKYTHLSLFKYKRLQRIRERTCVAPRRTNVNIFSYLYSILKQKKWNTVALKPPLYLPPSSISLHPR